MLPCARTGVSRPVAIIEAISTSIDLPEPAIGAVNTCSGALGSDARTRAVKMADSATERLASSVNGKVAISSFKTPTASTASSRVGEAARFGKAAPWGSNNRPVRASYPGSSRTEPSARSVGALMTRVSAGSCHWPSRSRYVSATSFGQSIEFQEGDLDRRSSFWKSMTLAKRSRIW